MIYTLDANNQLYLPNILGTCVAVNCNSGQLLLTAKHVVLDANNNPRNNNQFILAKRITKGIPCTTTPSPALTASVVFIPASDGDVAVLKCNTVITERLTICATMNDIPVAGSEEDLKYYHCPVTLYYKPEFNVISVGPGVKGKMQLLGNTEIYVSEGAVPGSSGGPLVDTQSRVVGIITGGFNAQTPTLSHMNCLPNLVTVRILAVDADLIQYIINN